MTTSSFYTDGDPNTGVEVAGPSSSAFYVDSDAAANSATQAAASAAAAAASASTAAAAATTAIAASAGTATPLVDGTAAVGVSTKWAHEDHVHPTDTSRADAAATTAALALKAPLASPAFTGSPTAPTPSVGDNSTKIATTAFVKSGVALAASTNFNTVTSPGTYYTIDALSTNAPTADYYYLFVQYFTASYVSQTAVGVNTGVTWQRINLAGTWQSWRQVAYTDNPTFTGTPAAPTASVGTNTTQIATTAFVLANSSANFLQAGTGAVSRTMQDKARDIVSVKDFGATGNGSTDDTAAIQAAITYANSLVGAQVYVPAGSYRIIGTGAQIFLSSSALRMSGSGQSSTVFLLDSTIPTTRDFIRFNTACTGILLEDFTIVPAASAVGRHLFHFDSTGAPVTFFRNVTIQRIFALATAAGHSVYLNNTGAVTVQGGVFQGIIRDNNFFAPSGFSCIKGVEAGDSLFIERNLLSGAGYAIDIKQIAGAGQLNIISNNITAAGMVKIDAAISVNIAFNEIEQLALNNSTNNAIIDLNGSSGAPISSAKIISNQIQAIAGNGDPTLIRVNWATNTVIDSNFLYVPAAYNPVVITANAADTIMGPGNAFTGLSAAISDSGVRTRGVWASYTSTFSSTTGTATVVARRMRDGDTVFVSISVTLTSAVTGTFAVTLPTNSKSNAIIGGKEIAMLGTAAAGFVVAGSNSLSVLNYAGGQYTGSGNVIVLNDSYEAA